MTDGVNGDLEILADALSSNDEVTRRIAETGLNWILLLLKKNADYGNSAMQVPILAPSLNNLTAIQVRMSDKINRLANLLRSSNPGPLIDESIQDTMRDLGAYSLLWLIADSLDAEDLH